MRIESRHKCPYCGYVYHSELGGNVFAYLLTDPGMNVAVHSVIRVCPHIDCKKAEALVDVGSFPAVLRGRQEEERHLFRQDLPGASFHRRILPPESGGKQEFKTPQVPEAIYRDYDEACKLLEISPSASATYARRCLQNMLRARFKIKPGKLSGEINALSSLSPPVSQEVLEALDHVRKLGRFNAHPEDEIRVVREITDDAAKRIIDVIEILISDFFIAPAEHSERLEALRLLMNKKPPG